MKKVKLLAAVFSLAVLASNVHATNGDNLIGVGPTSRAMGGTGIAAPQDHVCNTGKEEIPLCTKSYLRIRLTAQPFGSPELSAQQSPRLFQGETSSPRHRRFVAASFK